MVRQFTTGQRFSCRWRGPSRRRTSARVGRRRQPIGCSSAIRSPIGSRGRRPPLRGPRRCTVPHRQRAPSSAPGYFAPARSTVSSARQECFSAHITRSKSRSSGAAVPQAYVELMSPSRAPLTLLVSFANLSGRPARRRRSVTSSHRRRTPHGRREPDGAEGTQPQCLDVPAEELTQSPRALVRGLPLDGLRVDGERWPSTSPSSEPTEKVRAVHVLEHGTDGSALVAAVASANVNR